MNSRGRAIRAACAALGGLALMAASATTAFASCGEIDEGCAVPLGQYVIAMPQQKEAAAASQETESVPVVVFLHGYGGSAGQVLNNQALGRALTRRGYAVIAPQGLRRDGEGPRSWSFGPFSGGRDEAAFLDQVLADAAARFGVSSTRTVLAGFSAGAFMVHYLACAAPQGFAAYAPVAGAFWQPQPDSCAGPVRLFHVHGWRDAVVPLEGRPLGGGRWQQGDVFAALALWREVNGCAWHAPQRSWSHEGHLRRRWHCGGQHDIDLLLFDGGHQVPSDWADWMIDWFEGTADTR